MGEKSKNLYRIALRKVNISCKLFLMQGVLDIFWVIHSRCFLIFSWEQVELTVTCGVCRAPGLNQCSPMYNSAISQAETCIACQTNLITSVGMFSLLTCSTVC